MIDYFARRLWAAMLWLMRRPWMRRIQRASYGWLPPRMQEAARQNIARQDRFARRVGLPLMRLTVFIVFFSLASTVAFMLVLRWIESTNGALSS